MLSVIVPTYNERESLPALIGRLSAVRRALPLELVVVDDASPDGTGALAAALGREAGLPTTVVHREHKAGLASAAIDGAAAARGEIVAVLDADLSHPPELLPKLAAAVERGADIAVASRYTPGGGIERWPLARRLVSLGATWLARRWLGLPVRDPLSGFFAVRREVLARRTYMGIGYKLLVEILARHPGARVVELPYRFVNRARGTSKLSVGEIVDYVRLLARLKRGERAWNSASS